MADNFRKKSKIKNYKGQQNALLLEPSGAINAGDGAAAGVNDNNTDNTQVYGGYGNGEHGMEGISNKLFHNFNVPQENEGDFDRVINATMKLDDDNDINNDNSNVNNNNNNNGPRASRFSGFSAHQFLAPKFSVTGRDSKTRFGTGTFGGGSVAAGGPRYKSSVMSQQLVQHSDIIQKLRCESKIKWKILLCFLFVKSAAIINLLALSSMEEVLDDTLGLDSLEFGLLTGIVFVVAAFFSLLVPTILDKINVYRASVIAQILLTVGQVLFVFGCGLGDESKVVILGVIYGSRVVFGCGFALVQVCTYTVVSIWFGASKWNSFALLTISQTVEIGILLARYATPSLYDASDGNNWAAYSIGIVWGVVSIFTTLLALYYESQFNKFLKKHFQRQTFAFLKRISLGPDNKPDVNPILEDDVQYGLTMFSLKVWIIMILINIGWANIETYSSQMTSPIAETFGVSEDTADTMLSASTIVSFVLSPIAGWIAGKFGRVCLDVYVFITQITMILAVLAFWYPENALFKAIHCNGIYAGWISIFLFFTGLQTFYGGVFPLLFVECPAYLVGIANSVNAFLYLIWAFVEILLFGELKDVTGTWYWSVGLVGYSSVLGLILSFVLIWIIKKENSMVFSKKTQLRNDLENNVDNIHGYKEVPNEL